MATLTAAIASLGWLAACSVCAQPVVCDECSSGFAIHDSRWLDALRSSSRGMTIGYVWRDVKLERSVFPEQVQDENKPIKTESPKLDLRSTRLSFNPAPDWTLQLSRGSLSGLDQLVADGDMRRTAISATYRRTFKEGDWQTTLAWGRNARKFREATAGYLLESTLRLGGTHAMFGRLEQVGSDELMRENESLQRRPFKMNKLTIGYFQEIKTLGSTGWDVGVFISRHFVPADMSPSYGSDPTAYMMFVRLKLQ